MLSAIAKPLENPLGGHSENNFEGQWQECRVRRLKPEVSKASVAAGPASDSAPALLASCLGERGSHGGKAAGDDEVEEFFEWQQRQDRNYELVDGVPVLCRRPVMGSPDDALRVLRNVMSLLPDMAGWQIDGRLPSATSSKADMTVSVVPSTGAGFDFARSVAKLILAGQSTLLLLDTEEPRATLWSGKGRNRQAK